jgi:hypothetical protein
MASETESIDEYVKRLNAERPLDSAGLYDPHTQWMKQRSYRADNYMAYYVDLHKDTNRGVRSIFMYMKTINFVPCLDRWCLGCGKKAVSQRCSKCKSVYFCSRQCQKDCWPIHKRHCGRSLFDNCATCGEALKYVCDESDKGKHIKCPNCPIRFCNAECKDAIYEPHVGSDCEELSKRFGVEGV